MKFPMTVVVTGGKVNEAHPILKERGEMHFVVAYYNTKTGEKRVDVRGKLDEKNSRTPWRDFFKGALANSRKVYGWDYADTNISITEYSPEAFKNAKRWAGIPEVNEKIQLF